ncbi:MAG TPA: hypothetical protein VKH65_02470, partial [Myxococcales bacterium]|nr:hypothetical protein [Myxococcales bacterium]
MEFQPLQQRVLGGSGFGGRQHRPIDDQPAVLRRDRRGFRLDEHHQCAKPRLLFLLRARVAKQVERTRKEQREFLRAGHG